MLNDEIALEGTPTRFALAATQTLPGGSGDGESEQFELGGVRSLYGGAKLASEILIADYAAVHGLRIVINRCGVVTGSGQFGKVDQGV